MQKRPAATKVQVRGIKSTGKPEGVHGQPRKRMSGYRSGDNTTHVLLPYLT